MYQNAKKLFAFSILSIVLCGCSVLGVYIVEDSLTADQHNDLAVSYERQGKMALAEKEYKRAIKKDPNWYVPYFNLGNVYYKILEKNDAIRYYKLALDLNPDNADIMNNLAFVLMETGNLSDAEKWIHKALATGANPQYLDTKEKIDAQLKAHRKKGGEHEQ